MINAFDHQCVRDCTCGALSLLSWTYPFSDKLDGEVKRSWKVEAMDGNDVSVSDQEVECVLLKK